ncbi:MAG: hypothetical protein KR126chlam1_00925 [Chlamydiae bacterium]|nr:hypothetical protein [Chlamydiota bacterium]
MKRLNTSEKLLVEEVAQIAEKAKRPSRGLSIGALIKMIRNQLGMSQKALARRAHVPQSTISRIEKGTQDTKLSTLNKVMEALSGDLVILPMLNDSLDAIRGMQARKKAAAHIRYLKGTMSLEDQEPDPRLLEELLKQEENRLLQASGSELWGK